MGLNSIYGNGGTGGGSGTPDPTGTAAQLNSVTPSATPSNWSPKAIQDFVNSKNVALDGADYQGPHASFGGAALTAPTMPATAEGGGAVLKGMHWTYTGPTVVIPQTLGLGPYNLTSGDTIYALVDNPGQSVANWGTQDGAAGSAYTRVFNTGVTALWGADIGNGVYELTIPETVHNQGRTPGLHFFRPGTDPDTWRAIALGDNYDIRTTDGRIRVRTTDNTTNFMLRIQR